MAISHDDVLHVARLAKLRISDDQVETLTQELNTIVAFMNRLESAQVDGVQPTAQVTGLKDALRADVVRAYEDPQRLVHMAPRFENESFVVRSVQA